ncbi:FAD-dependent monooxygenase [Yoonia litorea]|uniref:Salicylate hydroxylase n=1 Tax=Yoonia litorea TaxID=1123755 RepID=A0A1I6LZ53_9RHOB|nr:FAD-dependent monooxygenase [Yoonia litorea]SFS08654.1 salicylate hydroxylase [Yoonia litorea]
MRFNTDRNVAIIGGGIGGLTAALAFAQSGASVTVYEQAPALTEVGAGLQITPNGMRALDKLGLGKALAASGIAADAVVPTDAHSGKPITRFDLTAQSPRYRFFHRAVLIDILGRGCEAAGVRVELGARIGEVRPDGSFQHGADRVKPDLTVGADGLHSTLRPLMNKADKPFFTGQVAWRALTKVNAVPPVARIWMAKGRHLVTYPIGNNWLNIVAVQERGQWAKEGWHHPDDPGNLRKAFADCSWEVKSILAEVTHVNLWGLFRHPVAQRWHTGSIALLGDAAHPTLPFLAQGANLAIEDAYVLARTCDETADLQAALPSYQSKRRPRVVRAIEAANSNARNYHLGGVKRRVAHLGLKTLGTVAPNAFLNRLGWLYDHDVTA